MNIQIKDLKKNYAIVIEKNYNKYNKYTYVERICYSQEEAEYVKESLERIDKISFKLTQQNI